MKHYELVDFLSNLNVNLPCTNIKPPRAKVNPPIDDFLAKVLGQTYQPCFLYLSAESNTIKPFLSYF